MTGPTKNSDAALEAELIASGNTTIDALKLRLASQIAPKRWARYLNAVASDCESGHGLDNAFSSHSARMPRELRCLIQESMQLADPGGFLIDALRARDAIQRSWRELFSLIAYPVSLLLFALFVGSGFTWILTQTIDLSWMNGFGLPGYDAVIARINDQHNAVFGMTVAAVWAIACTATIYFLGPPWSWVSVIGGISIVGRPFRWIALHELINRYEMFIRQGVHGIDAANAVARSFQGGSLSVVSLRVAQRIELGTPIGRSLASSILCDELCKPALLLLDAKRSADASAFHDASTLMGRLAEQRCRALGMILPVFVLAAVGTTVWASISAYLLVFTPIVSMITALW